MTPDEQLAFDIKLTLSRHCYRKPPRLSLDDPKAADKYYRAVAAAVVKQLKLSWNFELKPPRQ